MAVDARPHKPKVAFPGGKRFIEIATLMREHQLHTVCEEARCPNVGECFNAGTATFMILGEICTRACGFCAVTSGRPQQVDLLEPLRLARTVETLGLDYVVITSVNRDDLPDGGSGIFAACIRAIRQRTPGTRVEVLTPDFMGNWDALATVVEARPDVYNHNTETVPRFFPRARPKGEYRRTLELLRRVKDLDPTMPTKSGIMVGFGERMDEIEQTLRDVREARVDLLTVGQYLRPSEKHMELARYYAPEEFEQIARFARALGFLQVESGALVRSSYHARAQAASAAEAGVGIGG